MTSSVDLPRLRHVTDVIDLVDPESQLLYDLDLAAARELLARGDAAQIAKLAGSFALVARDGEKVHLARSLDRPLRYFLAKEKDGPLLVVADRMDAIGNYLQQRGLGDQFQPSYTRMVPAHHLTTLRLIGCPDPNPVHQRFFAPPRGVLPADLDLIGERYVGALLAEVDSWLGQVDPAAPIGVLFSGGIDSGAVLVALYHRLLATGASPARLKAFTLDVVDAGAHGGNDARQAREFLRRLDLEFLGETIEVESQSIDFAAAVAVLEDYKKLDVECAAMLLPLLQGIRARYPDWTWLADGDGGDENLKDYPIEDNPELTIRSVVNNSMLYQEGWGVDAVKHSLTYSGGLSRSCVRGWAPARRHGFRLFSPFMRPEVIAVAEAIPFAELTGGSHEALYRLKGEVVARGFRRLLGIDMPIFPKCRFQQGAVSPAFAERFAPGDQTYRRLFLLGANG